MLKSCKSDYVAGRAIIYNSDFQEMGKTGQKKLTLTLYTV